MSIVFIGFESAAELNNNNNNNNNNSKLEDDLKNPASTWVSSSPHT